MKLRHKLLIGLPVLALLCAGALWWGIQYTGKKALAEAMAGVVADGGVTDFRVFARPDLADADNAAVAWLAAVEPLEAIDEAAAWEKQEAELDVSGDPYSADPYGGDEGYAAYGGGDAQPEVEAIKDPGSADPAVLRSAIDKRQAVIEALWSAADLEAVCWPLDYDDPSSFFDVSYYGEMRRAARLLAADAVAALADGDAARADRSLTAALAGAEDVAALPLLINVLVAYSMDALVMGVIRDADRAGLADLPQTRAVLADRASEGWLHTGFLLEATWAVKLKHDDPVWSGMLWNDANPVPAGLRGIAGRLWRRHDLAFNTERLRNLAELTEVAYPAAGPRAEAIAERPVPAVFPISRIDLDLGQGVLRTAAVVALTRELCGWAARRGAGEAPQDPLFGGPLRRWESSDGGVVLWCAEAMDPGMSGFGRTSLVWRVGTDALPPELMPFADEINEID